MGLRWIDGVARCRSEIGMTRAVGLGPVHAIRDDCAIILVTLIVTGATFDISEPSSWDCEYRP